jgi:hypothetical protein
MLFKGEENNFLNYTQRNTDYRTGDVAKAVEHLVGKH